MRITYRQSPQITEEQVAQLYLANRWPAGEDPRRLHRALLNSATLVTAWHGERLVGLANAITDGWLVVYYPHLLVHPDYRLEGIGRTLMEKVQRNYATFHQQVVAADGAAVEFYRKCGFAPADGAMLMWKQHG